MEITSMLSGSASLDNYTQITLFIIKNYADLQELATMLYNDGCTIPFLLMSQIKFVKMTGYSSFLTDEERKMLTKALYEANVRLGQLEVNVKRVKRGGQIEGYTTEQHNGLASVAKKGSEGILEAYILEVAFSVLQVYTSLVNGAV